MQYNGLNPSVDETKVRANALEGAPLLGVATSISDDDPTEFFQYSGELHARRHNLPRTIRSVNLPHDLSVQTLKPSTLKPHEYVPG